MSYRATYRALLDESGSSVRLNPAREAGEFGRDVAGRGGVRISHDGRAHVCARDDGAGLFDRVVVDALPRKAAHLAQFKEAFEAGAKSDLAANHIVPVHGPFLEPQAC